MVIIRTKLRAHHQNIHVCRTCSSANLTTNAYQTISFATTIMIVKMARMNTTARSPSVNQNISAVTMVDALITFGNAVRLIRIHSNELQNA